MSFKSKKTKRKGDKITKNNPYNGTSGWISTRRDGRWRLWGSPMTDGPMRGGARGVPYSCSSPRSSSSTRFSRGLPNAMRNSCIKLLPPPTAPPTITPFTPTLATVCITTTLIISLCHPSTSPNSPALKATGDRTAETTATNTYKVTGSSTTAKSRELALWRCIRWLI